MLKVTFKAPWRERNGRFSALKAVVFASLFAPAAYILFQLATGALEPKPVTELIHRSGDWAIRLILLSLLITPLRKILDWPKLIAIRRMVGYEARGPASGPIVIAIVKSPDKDEKGLFEEAKRLVRANVGG